jgi:chromosome segregation ATPase
VFVIAVGMIAAGGARPVRVSAQEAVASDGSLAALTAEVRLLRQAIEKSSQTQSQLQALTVYISAEQSRLVQTSARAGALAKDVDMAARQSADLADRIAALEKSMANPLTVPPEVQKDMASQLESFKQEQPRARAAEEAVRARFLDATTAVQAELARWNDLMARLDQATH